MSGYQLRPRLIVAIAILTAALGCSTGPGLDVVTAGGEGPPTLVLLHGFGSTAAEWEPFTQTLDWRPPARFVFPQGPQAAAEAGGLADGRAWWPLQHRPGDSPERLAAELSQSRPPGLEASAAAVGALVRRLAGPSGGTVVLGGFSQGAMVASEVAYRTESPIAALVLLSGALVDESSWRSGYARRRGLPVFIAHGRNDSVLPFSGSERMQRELAAAGQIVTWHPFDGDHEIPEGVVTALNRFLADVRKQGTDLPDGR